MHLSLFTNTRRDLVSHVRGPRPSHIDEAKWVMLRENLVQHDSLQRIADRRGISRERVRQILEGVNYDFWYPPFPNLSKRTSRLLRDAGYGEPQKLFTIPDEDLMQVPGFGKATLAQVREHYPFRRVHA